MVAADDNDRHHFRLLIINVIHRAFGKFRNILNGKPILNIFNLFANSAVRIISHRKL